MLSLAAEEKVNMRIEVAGCGVLLTDDRLPLKVRKDSTSMLACKGVGSLFRKFRRESTDDILFAVLGGLRAIPELVESEPCPFGGFSGDFEQR